MTKEDIYRALAQLYKFTPEQCANMTFYQQSVLLDSDSQKKTIHFNTLEEFNAWKLNKNGR